MNEVQTFLLRKQGKERKGAIDQETFGKQQVCLTQPYHALPYTVMSLHSKGFWFVFEHSSTAKRKPQQALNMGSVSAALTRKHQLKHRKRLKGRAMIFFHLKSV